MTQVRYLLKDPTLCQLQIESDAAAKDGSSVLVLVLVPVGVGIAGGGAWIYGGSLTEVGIAALIYTLVVGAAVIEALYKVCGKVCGASCAVLPCASIFARIATQGLVQRWGSGDGSRMVATSAEILALASTMIAEPCRQPDKAR